MPRPKKVITPAVAVPAVTPDNVPAGTLDTLGVRHGDRIVVRDVQATHLDGRLAFTDKGPLMIPKEVKEKYTDVQPLLTTEEAKKLGKQNWRVNNDGNYTCVVNGRRFCLDPEYYEELCGQPE